MPLAKILARYGALLAVGSLIGLAALQSFDVISLATGEWVQLAIAAATLVLASAAGSLALDGREHADLLERHIKESAKVAEGAARQASETAQLARSNEALAAETMKLAQVAVDGLEVSREMAASASRELVLREKAELRKITPSGKWFMSQASEGAGAAIVVGHVQGDIETYEAWVEVQAWQTQDVFKVRDDASEPGILKTQSISIGSVVTMAKMQIACRSADEPWVYREIHVHFGSGERRGTNSSVGEWIREVPDWPWIQQSSGVPARALGKM